MSCCFISVSTHPPPSRMCPQPGRVFFDLHVHYRCLLSAVPFFLLFSRTNLGLDEFGTCLNLYPRHNPQYVFALFLRCRHCPP